MQYLKCIEIQTTHLETRSCVKRYDLVESRNSPIYIVKPYDAPDRSFERISKASFRGDHYQLIAKAVLSGRDHDLQM